MPQPETLSLPAARRIALAAQGFARARPERPPQWTDLRRTLDRTQLLQIDSVNVLARAHYLPLFSRLGSYDRAVLEEAAWGARRPRRLFEYWAHEASLLPVELQPLLRWRMARAERGEGTWGRLAAFAAARRPEADAILRRIEAEGPLAASDLEGKGDGSWWGWSDAKQAVEWLFWSGRLTTRTRRPSFERVYDLPERVLPRAVLDAPTPEPADAHRALLLRAAPRAGRRHCGRPARLLSPQARRRPSPHCGAGRGGRAASGRGARLEPARLPAPRGAHAASRGRVRAAGSVRPR